MKIDPIIHILKFSFLLNEYNLSQTYCVCWFVVYFVFYTYICLYGALHHIPGSIRICSHHLHADASQVVTRNYMNTLLSRHECSSNKNLFCYTQTLPFTHTQIPHIQFLIKQTYRLCLFQVNCKFSWGTFTFVLYTPPRRITYFANLFQSLYFFCHHKIGIWNRTCKLWFVQ